MSIEIEILNGDVAWPEVEPLHRAVWPPEVVASPLTRLVFDSTRPARSGTLFTPLSTSATRIRRKPPRRHAAGKDTWRSPH